MLEITSLAAATVLFSSSSVAIVTAAGVVATYVASFDMWVLMEYVIRVMALCCLTLQRQRSPQAKVN